MRTYGLFAWFRSLGNQRGQVAILVGASALMLAGFGALAVDVGNYTHQRQRLQNALDAASLAGAHKLPLNPNNNAEIVARDFLESNGFGREMNVSYGCLVRRDPDNPTQPIETDVLSLCKQYRDQPFNCQDNDQCYRDCRFDFNPAVINPGCNVIRVNKSVSVPLLLAPIASAFTAFEADLKSDACRGLCGTPPDLDAMIIIDRSSTMNRPNGAAVEELQITQARQGARDVVRDTSFVEQLHFVGVAIMPPDNGVTLISPLTDGYNALADLIDAHPSLQFGAGSNTDLAGTIRVATDELFKDPLRQGVNKQIIILTDGAPDACQAAVEEAQRAKDRGVQIFTIGYGLDPVNLGTCDDQNVSEFQFAPPAELLAVVASNNSEDDQINCEAENDDNDNFLCQTEGEPIAPVFERVILQILNDVGEGSSLVDLTPHQP